MTKINGTELIQPSVIAPDSFPRGSKALLNAACERFFRSRGLPPGDLSWRDQAADRWQGRVQKIRRADLSRVRSQS